MGRFGQQGVGIYQLMIVIKRILEITCSGHTAPGLEGRCLTGSRGCAAHDQRQLSHGMAEKMVDRIGLMLRTTLLQSQAQLPPEFWGDAAIVESRVTLSHATLHISNVTFICT